MFARQPPTAGTFLSTRTLGASSNNMTAYDKRGWDPMWLARALSDPSRPTFLFGSTPPREGTTPVEAAKICSKFVARSRAHASDGFIVYDIQDESARNAASRPFPFQRTIEPSDYAALFPPESGKSTVLYHACSEPDEAAFDKWLDDATMRNHHTLNLVGPSSSREGPRLSMERAAALVKARKNLAFGCVTIAERHLTKGTEHLNILRKVDFGAQWFISQAVYDAEATIKLLHDYADECRRRGQKPVKILLTFAPVGRPKTLEFARWLGIHMPEAVEQRILAKANASESKSKEAAVLESIDVCCEALERILSAAGQCGVPLGLSVESISGFREEIDGCFEMFRRLQAIMLDSKGSPWAVRWYRVPVLSMARSNSGEQLAALEAKLAALEEDKGGQLAGGQQPTAKEELAVKTKEARIAMRDSLKGFAAGIAVGAVVAVAISRKLVR